jgi:hypothetical protein
MGVVRLAQRGALLAAAVLLCATDCATPTALTVDVYSEVPCASGAAVALIGGGTLGDLAARAPSTESSECTPDGAEANMGNVVLVPTGARNEGIAFAVMTRPDGQPPDQCLDPSQAGACIVAKREISFLPQTELDMRIDLRLSCLGVPCTPDTTCVEGQCVPAQVPPGACTSSCGENTLVPDGGISDSGALEDAPSSEDAGKLTDSAVDTVTDAGGDATQPSGNDAGVDAGGAGQPAVLASGQSGAYAIAVDTTSVYWTNNANPGTVSKIPIGGGTVTVLASGQDEPNTIAVDSTSVYFTDDGTYTVNKVPLAGGTVTTLATGPTGPWGIRVSTTEVIVAYSFGIEEVPVGGGALSTLYSGGNPAGLVTDGTSAYWTNWGASGTVVKIPIGGGALTTVASGQNDPLGIAVDTTSVYFTDQGTGTINKVALAGGSVTVLASGQDTPAGIVVDATNVYWANEVTAGTVNAVPLAGGSVTVLASGQNSPYFLAVDSTSVYWTNNGSGQIMKVAK